MVTQIKRFEKPPAEQMDSEAVADTPEFHHIAPEKVSTAISLKVVPGQLLLGSLRDGRLRVHSPITVKFTKEDKYVIAEATEFNEFGFGENPSEALMDLQRAIAELYLTLEQEQNRLGEEMQRVWVALKQKINKR